MDGIFKNAVDSIQMGLRHFQDEALPTRDKWATLELFHAIELLLKERLYREHPLLIYRRLEKPIGDDAATVGLDEILKRFGNLGLELPKEYVHILQDLRRRRNRIEHHRFVPDESHRNVLGEALKFIHYFLDQHLEEDLEDLISPREFDEVKELILGYDELVRRAQANLEAAYSRFGPKDRPMLSTGTCPECGNRMVLVGGGDEDICYFCDKAVVVKMCQTCGEYLPPEDFAGPDICQACFFNKVGGA